jgi:hypothetical protein
MPSASRRMPRRAPAGAGGVATRRS